MCVVPALPATHPRFVYPPLPSVDRGTVEDDPEYQLIVEANNILLEIDQEIGIVHKFVRDRYCQRFPELEQLVLNPIDYIRTVKTIQNDLDLSKVDLTEVLAPATIMVVSVTASTTQGLVGGGGGYYLWFLSD